MKHFVTFGTVILASLSLGAATLTPSDILKSPDKFDKKSVTVSGTVKKFNANTSKSGNAYFTFQLTSGKDSVNVYSHGKLDKSLKDGDKVEVKGIFVKEKTVGKATYKNEVDCSGKKGEKPNLKVLK